MNKINAEIWRFPQPPNGPLTSVQVYKLIVKYIQTGIILPGSRIPSYRVVGKLNEIHRNTMFRIYKRLEDKGWLDPVKGSGTFVSLCFPNYDLLHPADRSIERLPVRLNNTPNIEIHNDHPPSDFIMLGLDTPGPHYLSHWLYLTQISKQAKVYGDFNQMDRISEMKSMEFKTAILDYLNKTRNFRISSSCLEVVLGRREALQQVFKVLLRPFDHVVNTAPRDAMVKKLITDCGAVLHDIKSFENGFIGKLKRLLKKTTIKALYVRQQCSYPEGYSIPENECVELLELAKKHQFYIIEEDDYHEFWYEIKPFKPLICQNHNGHVIYLGALSLLSIYMQQTRTIVAAAEFIQLMQFTYIGQSPFKDPLIEQAIAMMLNNNKLLHSIKKMQREKKEHMFEVGMQLVNALGNMVNVVKPLGGLSFWLEFPDARVLSESIIFIQKEDHKIPFHPYKGRFTLEEKNVCFGFGTWNVMEFQTPAKLLFEKLNSRY
ncbi:MAG: aminotransferase class I/II-fold pyridoxal phosphate-dependent enzyme [Candidatus Pedobacter colombiensis]|uniref:Aminotransferase class I/II-fold pyridoxal phosphate-dependent enzyme n=1 Tax=Candidatus Pedobacter colombiensis TaxID=3121371 RepID=A0AAJ5WDL2_9SPHI|nr:aminotransferase class I/II-fold pyridoxal phosphate-dependent enzyme [Pedobacter sp.]WEK21641.1 MAG: aminotransferase class I/II-fold pyridoxal phosphate-dependent enzyme [Pedobacter sp.]